MNKGVDLDWSGWQADQVETKSTNQCHPVRLLRWFKSRFSQPCQHESINIIHHPSRFPGLGNCHLLGSGPCPVTFPLRSLVDPATNQLHLVLVEFLAGIRWRHLQIGIFRADSLEQLAAGAIPRFHRRQVSIRKHALLQVQPQVRLASLFIGAMALVAVVRQDRPDLPVETDLLLSPGNHRKQHEPGEKERDEHETSARLPYHGCITPVVDGNIKVG